MSSVLALQMLSGIVLWLFLSGKKSFTVPEIIGVGTAFGSLLSLLSECAFRTTSFRDISWLFPGAVLIASTGFPVIRHKFLSYEIQKTDARDLAFLFSSAILALSLLWVWALPLVIVPFAISTYKSRRLHLIIASLSVLAIVGSQFLKSTSSSWWIFSHDQMYLEGFSEGIYRYGPNENMHLVGYGFPYHWFSLLWSAIITYAANLSPLIALGKILPIVAIMTSVNLLWLITRQHSKLAGYIAVSSFVIGSNAINWTAIRFTNSPTFLFSLIWLLAFAYVFQLAFSSKTFGLDFALALLLIGAFGGKVTHGIIILGGLGLVLVVETVKHRRFLGLSRLLQICGVLALATIFVYLLVYRGQRVGGRMLSFSPGELGFQVGVAYMSSSKWIWMAATIAVLIGCSSLFIISLHKASQSESDRILNVFCIGSFLLSLPLTFFLAQDGGSQGYFLLSASVIILIPASIVIAQLITSSNKPRLPIGTALALFFCAVFCYTVVHFWNSNPAGIDLYRFSLIFKVSAFIIPTTVFALIQIFFRDERKNLGLLLLFAVFLLFGVFHRTSTIQTYFNNFSESARTEPISGSHDRVVALTWLRNNSNENDIVATNRFCIPDVKPCDMKWYLTSAISKRRMLVEGTREPVLDSGALVEEKISASIEFGQSPSKQSYEFLRNFNTQWFVVDASMSNSNLTWEPYASVEFENTEMKILRLQKNLKPLP